MGVENDVMSLIVKKTQKVKLRNVKNMEVENDVMNQIVNQLQ